MAFQNITDRILRGNQVAVNIGQAKFILVFQEGNAHTFFEKAAEVSRLQKGHPGDFTDGDGTVLIPGRIGQYRVQTA